MLQDKGSIQQALLDWISNSNDLSKSLLEAVISENGATIALSEDVVLDARVPLSIPLNSAEITAGENQYCEYSVGAIYLQIRNPKQSLIVYRNDCKKYGVADPVKAVDKSTIVHFFLPAAFIATLDEAVPHASATAEETSATTEPSTKTSTAETAEKSDRSSKRPRDKEKHGHHSKSKSSSSGGKAHRSSSSGKDKATASEPPKKKKKPDLVTNEQLFEHLNVVVEKRTATASQKENDASLAEAISKALSATGFEIVDSEQLKPYQDRTAAIFANEIPVGNSASILRANNPRKNLSRVLELYMETVAPASTSAGGKPIKGGKVPAKPNTPSKKANTFKQYLVGKKPVIVVPKGMTAPITLTNAHEFLCNGHYVPRDAMMKQLSSSAQKTPPTTFTRTVATVGSSTTSTSHLSSTGLLEYEIIDNPRKLGPNPKEWERIVAVIVLGQSWQFKDWLVSPSYNVPASLFDRVYGFYLSMEGDKAPPEVATWAVHKSQLNRDKRGLDSVAHASFWNGLDEWMKVYKSELLPHSG